LNGNVVVDIWFFDSAWQSVSMDLEYGNDDIYQRLKI
jgi:hypothetical protein